MKKIKENIIRFIKKETILFVSSVIAIISMIIVPPSKEYISYIDFRVLSLLLCLMLVMAGLKGLGIFDRLMHLLLKHIKNTRQLSFTLIISCFLLSMWITNDVALITLVPFAIMICNETDNNKLLIPIIVLQTIAANLGSMCTPIGNPQNLYLYTASGMSVKDFLKLMTPLTLISFFLIIICLFIFDKKELSYNCNIKNDNAVVDKTIKFKTVTYTFLLILCLLTVLRLLDFKLLLLIILIAVALLEWRLFMKADYMLLLTFIAFFVFIGNIKQIDLINSFLHNIVTGNEVIVSILSSQIISNVPAAILLSGFTNDFSSLMIGTNIGGLGTLIASMASLISFKYYADTEGSDKKKYILVFTITNIIFLIILIAAYFTCKSI